MSNDTEWIKIPFIPDRQDIGHWMVNGTEVHLHINDGMKLQARRNAEIALDELMAGKEYLTTKIAKGDKLLVGEMMGFKKTWSDENFDYYMLTEENIKRKKKCQTADF